ncbi:MAG: hypothetical protein ACKPEY_11310 [Planctomycetota bacterium]
MKSLIGILASLVLVVGGVIAGMFYLRAQAIATYGTPAALEEWGEWRSAAAMQAAEQRPVERKIPKSAEPPALVLMRDYFPACTAAAAAAAAGCYLVFAFLLRGVLTGHRGLADSAQPTNQPERKFAPERS